jgi:hypothetical protein
LLTCGNTHLKWARELDPQRSQVLLDVDLLDVAKLSAQRPSVDVLQRDHAGSRSAATSSSGLS